MKKSPSVFWSTFYRTATTCLIITAVVYLCIGSSYVFHALDDTPYQCTFLMYDRFEKLLPSSYLLDQRAGIFGFLLSLLAAVPLFLFFRKGVREQLAYLETEIAIRKVKIAILSAELKTK